MPTREKKVKSARPGDGPLARTPDGPRKARVLQQFSRPLGLATESKWAGRHRGAGWYGTVAGVTYASSVLLEQSFLGPPDRATAGTASVRRGRAGHDGGDVEEPSAREVTEPGKSYRAK